MNYSREKILSLTKEIDDLKSSIDSLRKVNSSKVKEFENYKREAEQSLENAKQEYIRDKQDLQKEKDQEISNLNSAISILEKDQTSSKEDIDRLRSLLSSRPDSSKVIRELEDENEKLNTLYSSLKAIESSSREGYNRKLSEIEDQKNKVEVEKKKLETKIKKYISSDQKKNEEIKNLREENEKILSRMKELNDNRSRLVDKRLLEKSQNEFLQLQKKLKESDTNILEVLKEREVVEEREKLLKQELKEKEERIRVKDNENTEYIEKFKEFKKEKEEFNRKEKTFQQNIKDKSDKIREKNVTISRQREELEELKEKKEKLEYAIERQDFRKRQFDRLQADYNSLVESAQRQIDQGVRDKYSLEEELKETQKKLQEIQRSYIDLKDYENMLRDNQDLIETINLKDRDLLYTTKFVNELQAEKTTAEKKYNSLLQNIKKLDKSFKDYKAKVNEKDRENVNKTREDLIKIRQNYNDQLAKKDQEIKKQKENYEFQLSQRLRPGEIKSVQILLNNLSFDNLDEENYRDACIEYKTSRDNFLKKSEDQALPKVERLMYGELKKLADIRLDLLNMTFNRPEKTEAGKEFVRRTDQTLVGKFYRFRMRLSKYLAGTTLGAGIMGVVFMIL